MVFPSIIDGRAIGLGESDFFFWKQGNMFILQPGNFHERFTLNGIFEANIFNLYKSFTFNEIFHKNIHHSWSAIRAPVFQLNRIVWKLQVTENRIPLNYFPSVNYGPNEVFLNTMM